MVRMTRDDCLKDLARRGELPLLVENASLVEFMPDAAHWAAAANCCRTEASARPVIACESAAASDATTGSQLRLGPCRKIRMLGYHGVSSRSSSQRKQPS